MNAPTDEELALQAVAVPAASCFRVVVDWEDVAFCRFTGGPDGYLPLGDLMQRADDAPGGRCLLFGATPGSEQALAHPTGFEKAGEIAAGAFTITTCYRMIPPAGYRALGFCFSFGASEPPDPNNYWCVRSELTRPRPRSPSAATAR